MKIVRANPMKRLGILPTMLSLRRFSCTVRIEKTISIVSSIPETHIGAPLNAPIRIPLSAAHANPHAKDAIIEGIFLKSAPVAKNRINAVNKIHT